ADAGGAGGRPPRQSRHGAPDAGEHRGGGEWPTRRGRAPSLWAPEGASERAAAPEEIRAIAPETLTADPDDELTDAAQLAGLLPTLLHGGGDLSPELRPQLWDVLVDHQLVVVDGTVPAQVDAVIYTGAAPEELAVDTEDEEVATERAQSLLALQTHLLRRSEERRVGKECRAGWARET